jgi:hypothetical protein
MPVVQQGGGPRLPKAKLFQGVGREGAQGLWAVVRLRGVEVSAQHDCKRHRLAPCGALPVVRALPSEVHLWHVGGRNNSWDDIRRIMAGRPTDPSA